MLRISQLKIKVGHSQEQLKKKLEKAQKDLEAMQTAYDAMPEDTRKGLLDSMEYQLRQYEHDVDLFEAMLDERAEEEA